MAKIVTLYVASKAADSSKIKIDHILKKLKKFLGELAPSFDNFNKTVILSNLFLFSKIIA